jgi:hypothetical protein
VTDQDHRHSHPHGGLPADAADNRARDLNIRDADLRPSELSRREFLRGLGLLGVAVGAASVGGSLVSPRVARAATPRSPERRPGTDTDAPGGLLWLSGDHHIHTQYSSDGRYRVRDHVGHARRNGLDWMVITDHGRIAHEKVGIDRTHADVLDARTANPGMLVYQGLEWNIPGAEHGTVFLAPGPNEADLLHGFEANFDGVVVYAGNATKNDPVQEAKAVEGVRWLASQVAARRSEAALFLANHPARRGLDSPHEIRAWNDAAPSVAVGMEGAPGHQAGGVAKADLGPEAARGYYDFSAGAQSHPAYPPESYRTWGGFDWMTAKVGGLWDSLLAEGRPWWITANSDSHAVYRDTLVPGAGTFSDVAPFVGAYADPVDTGVEQAGNGDFWPGLYSRTVVGARRRSYASVMAAIAAGRMWVSHGGLIDGLDVLAVSDRTDSVATLGGTVRARRGESLELVIRIRPARQPNGVGVVPKLRRVDLIGGPQTGAASDRDAMSAPGTAVLRSWEIDRQHGVIVLSYRIPRVQGSMYLRLRGTDGSVSAPGSIEPRLDPVPMDPWTDLWFYSNPIFIDVE